MTPTMTPTTTTTTTTTKLSSYHGHGIDYNDNADNGNGQEVFNNPPSPSPPLRLVWHRRDLRLHDNFLYHQQDLNHPENNNNNNNNNDPSNPLARSSTTTTTRIASVFIIDPQDFTPQPSTCNPDRWDTVYVGPHSGRIMIDSLHCLRRSIRTKSYKDTGADLWIRYGDTVTTLVDLIQDIQPSEFWFQDDIGVYEQKRSKDVYDALTKRFPTLRIRTNLQYTLYHPDDLPNGFEEWDILARPNQSHSRKKKKNKKAKHQNNNKGKNTKDNSNGDQNKEAETRRQRLHADPFHSLVDVSSHRLREMPRIMGEWRKAARAYRSPVTAAATAAISSSLLSSSSNIRRTISSPTSIVGYYSNKNDKNETAMPKIDPGTIPTVEELYQPLLQSHRPILGLSSTTIRNIVDHAIKLSSKDDITTTLATEMNSAATTTEKRPTCDYRRGGEENAVTHVHEFVTYHARNARRNLASVENNDSSRFSHFLAWGCLSPRMIVETAETANRKIHGSNDDRSNNKDDCSWLISHMTMRDFFLYLCLSTGSQFYHIDGMPVNVKAAASIKWKHFRKDKDTNDVQHRDDDDDEQLYQRWATGQTGLPLVDAGMTELMETGYMSNRVRQNVASVLTKDLMLDWRAGAEMFQFLLSDHCVGANWGNWLYFSGVGPDPKQRHFRTVSQALRYDRNGEYVKKWLPYLREILPSTRVDHENDHNVEEDESYLRPWDCDLAIRSKLIVPPKSQYTWQDLQKLADTGHLLSSDR